MSDRDEKIIAPSRRFYEGFNRDDFDAATDVADPEIELVRPTGQPRLEALTRCAHGCSQTPSRSSQLEALEFSVKGNKVLVRDQATGRGAGSGIEVDDDGWTVWTLNDDGLATRLEFYLDHQEAEALEAAGLSE